MDAIFRDTVFAGFSDREIAEIVVVELRRRGLFGCLYAFPAAGGNGVFASSTPADLMTDLTASQQLAVFAEVASLAIKESKTVVPDVLDNSVDPKGFVN